MDYLEPDLRKVGRIDIPLCPVALHEVVENQQQRFSLCHFSLMDRLENLSYKHDNAPQG